MAEDEGGNSTFEGKYLAKVAEYESSNKWLEDVEVMDRMGDETYIYALEGRLEYMFPKLEHPLSQAEYNELKAANPELIAEEKAIAVAHLHALRLMSGEFLTAGLHGFQTPCGGGAHPGHV